MIEHGERRFWIAHTVLEGHRFAFESIGAGEPLLSWGLPFGHTTRDVTPGEYICNARILRALAERDIDFELPPEHNFDDHSAVFDLDPSTVQPGVQVPPVDLPGTFAGYERGGGRGVGTRNFIVVLALTSNDAALAETVAERCAPLVADDTNIDGVVAVTHTEGGGATVPNNLDFVLRTLAGFVVHPNTGAVLIVDHGAGSFTSAELLAFMTDKGYPLPYVAHASLVVDCGFKAALQRATKVVEGFLPQVSACVRTEQPLAGLRLALQCGGSDAFSGLSGNSLAGWVSKEVIRHGGAANLAETDELIGAEPYVLANVRNGEVAARFLKKIEQFKERAANHGANAEGNPSGGNNFRGLYNIALKSLGAARKKDPQVRLDHVLDYAEPMHEGGYYFMDSPGNDLESIAGQVAAGCNLILFITGNGSITNFPFVPTLKFVTTTGRFELLSNEMDVNAGRYNDGEPMHELGQETFELARRVASGECSKGERAGHSQVSIWREWRQTDASQLAALRAAPPPTGEPLSTVSATPTALSFDAYVTESGTTTDLVGLVMPTSLCSGQVAELIADHLNRRDERPGGLSRFIALTHTEGCGSANAEDLYLQTLLGHLRHPFTQRALLLEHGCEKTHNDAIRHWLAQVGEPADRYGFASVQLDGGIDAVRGRVVAWFDENLAHRPSPQRHTVCAEALRIGVLSTGPIDAQAATMFATLCAGITAAGGTLVLPENASLATSPDFLRALLTAPDAWGATLAYGQAPKTPGLHVMQSPTEDPSETLTGLGGTGVELMLAHIGDRLLQAHPMIPLLQVSADPHMITQYRDDLDGTTITVAALNEQISETASGRYRPKLFGAGNVRFQLTRGKLGISL